MTVWLFFAPFFIKISHKLGGYHRWDSIFMIIMNSRKKEGGYRIMNNTVCAKLYIPSISRHCYVKFSIFWFVIPIICQYTYVKSRNVGHVCKWKLFKDSLQLIHTRIKTQMNLELYCLWRNWAVGPLLLFFFNFAKVYHFQFFSHFPWQNT